MRTLLAVLVLLTLAACASSPWAVEAKEQIRTEQAKDFDEKTNLERRLADLEAGARESQDGETVALRRRVAELEDAITAGDAEIASVEKQDTNSQISLWASIAAGVLGIGGIGKATMGKSRSAPAIEGLEIKLARGELEIDRLADELHKKIDGAQAIVDQKLSQLAAILQAVQIGLNQPVPSAPNPTKQPVVPNPNDSSTPTA